MAPSKCPTLDSGSKDGERVKMGIFFPTHNSKEAKTRAKNQVEVKVECEKKQNKKQKQS
jgi:hypothetical protein